MRKTVSISQQASPKKPRRQSTKSHIGHLHSDNVVSTRKLVSCLQRFPQAKVLVIGDLILDHYIWGHVHRISPEAPVPIVHVDSESLHLGGAANVFQNVVALEGQADICGVVGLDDNGRVLLKKLGLRRQHRGGVIIDSDRPTTRKTRILANSQQIVRYDVEQRHDVSEKTTHQILHYVQSCLSDISCLVISDYAKGVVTPLLMHELNQMVGRHRIPLVVDPKIEHFPYFANATVMTPNYDEATQGVHYLMGNAETKEEPGHLLREKLGCEAVLVTQGSQGMTLCEEGKTIDIPAVARQVYDVTGAGDTVVSTMALALSTGASIHEGAVLANHAAGQVVGMVGTASITRAHLKNTIQQVPLS
ncbi:MAG: D-glycero-beta-D-manno-heptose-7-phosphate kinase [Nitrospirales bacterium]|nr:D-glycero-beta-D-manno-heptose-7-phosphate kinase [Nitrospirales bacterium]